jgi:hypothetical protein
MSGIYQVYTMIINFLGFPDGVKLCSKRLSFVRNQMLTEMLRTTGPGTHFKLALTSESDRQTSKFPDPYFENILFST